MIRRVEIDENCPTLFGRLSRSAAVRSGLAAVAAFGAGHARAQALGGGDEQRMDIGIGVHGYYDSDSVRGQNVLNARPDAQRQDFITEPNITEDIVAPIGRQSVFLNGSLGYRLYTHNSFLNRENIHVSGGFRVQPLRGCSATITGNYVQQQSELYDIIDGFDPRNVEKIGGAGADISCQSASGLTPGLSYRRTRATNSSIIRKANEYVSDNYTASLGYSRPNLGTISLYASYNDARYPRRRFFMPGFPADGTQVYSGGLSYERAIGTRLTGSVSVGYTTVNPRLPGVKDFKGANWDAALAYDSRNRIRANLSFSRSVEQSNLLGDSYGVRTGLNLTGEYAFSDRIRLTAGGAYVRRRSEQSPLYQLPNFNSRDRTVSVYSKLAVGNVGPVAIVFEAAREHRKSVVPVYNYGSTRFGVSATYRFGR
jgi:hypothetical protein